MALFVIADLHLSFSTDKPMDVFEGWKDYTQRIKDRWISIVKPSDTVVLAGDISWAMRLEDTLPDFAYLHSLPGKKLLLKGNHDYWWSTKRKIESFLHKNGFDDIHILHNCAYQVDDWIVCGTRGWIYQAKTPEDLKITNREAGRLSLSLKDAQNFSGEPIVFLHYPPVYDNVECSEILDVLLQHHIRKCYFGHIHGKYAAKKILVGEYKGIDMHLCACDYLNFTPLLVR